MQTRNRGNYDMRYWERVGRDGVAALLVCWLL